MKTVRRPPYPKWNPGYFPCSSLTPLPLSSRRPSVSFGGFGLTGQGRYPITGKNEIAVEKRMADKHGLSVGDHIVFRVVGGDAEEEAWTVSGIVFTPYASFIDSGGFPVPGDKSIFATFEDAQAMAGFVGFSAFYVRYIDFPTAKEQSDRFYTSIAQETPYVPVFNFLDDPAESLFITNVEEFTSIMSFLGVIAMVVSGLLIVNIINSIVAEQKRQIGVMKSLGATRWDNFVMYVGIAMTYGVIGMIPGLVAGSYLGALTAQAADQAMGTFIEGFSLSTSGILTGVVMGLAVPVVAAIVPVFLGTRVTILQAMPDVGISGNYRKGLLGRAINIMPLPTNTKQAITNVTRKKGRLVLTWLTLTLAVAGFMGIFAMFASFSALFGGAFDVFGFEASVTPNERQDFDQVSALISEGVDGINAIYPGVVLAVELEGYVNPDFETGQLGMFGFDPGTDSLNLDLAVEEASANIVRHAYRSGQARDILLRMETTDDVVRITLTDWGLPFDAESVRPFDDDAPVETRAKGGMGLRIIHSLMDNVVRETASAAGGPNVITLSKHVAHRCGP